MVFKCARGVDERDADLTAAAFHGALTRAKPRCDEMTTPAGNALRNSVHSRWIHDELRRIDDHTRHFADTALE